MNPTIWKNLYSTGIEQIDRHNLCLFELLDHAHQRMTKSRGPKLKRIDFEDILHYTQFHFAREEVWMAHSRYPALSDHEEEHKQLRQRVAELCIAVQHDTASTKESLKLLMIRLLHHINTWDAEYANSDSAGRLSSYLGWNRTTRK